jgi:hypothetical protein
MSESQGFDCVAGQGMWPMTEEDGCQQPVNFRAEIQKRSAVVDDCVHLQFVEKGLRLMYITVIVLPRSHYAPDHPEGVDRALLIGEAAVFCDDTKSA